MLQQQASQAQLDDMLSFYAGHQHTVRFPPPAQSGSNRSYRSCQWCQLLCENGASVDTTDARGCTPLMTACYKGNYPTVQVLLDFKPHLHEASGEVASTALHYCAQSNSHQCVHALLCAGANPNIVDSLGRTPLHISASQGAVQSCESMVHAQYQGESRISPAQLNQPDAAQHTAIAYAAMNGHLAVCKLLTTAGAGLNECVSMTATIIVSGNPFSSGGTWGTYTPLMLASSRGHADVVEHLIEHGADMTLTDFNGCTCLMAASKQGHVDVCRLLTGAGADLNAKGASDRTALWYAANAGSVEVVLHLIGEGANVAQADSNGVAPLTAASMQGHIHVAKALVNAEAIRMFRNARGPL